MSLFYFGTPPQNSAASFASYHPSHSAASTAKWLVVDYAGRPIDFRTDPPTPRPTPARRLMKPRRTRQLIRRLLHSTRHRINKKKRNTFNDDRVVLKRFNHRVLFGFRFERPPERAPTETGRRRHQSIELKKGRRMPMAATSRLSALRRRSQMASPSRPMRRATFALGRRVPDFLVDIKFAAGLH